MARFSWKILYFILISGTFALVALAAANYQNLNADVYLIIYLVLIFLLLFGCAMAWAISRPLKKIVEAANELAEGNMHSRAHVRGDDELAQVAQALNKIGQNIEKSHKEKEELGQSVATKVHLITQPLHETIQALEQKVSHRTAQMHQATQLAQKLQFDLLLKEAEFVDLKGQMAKLMKRKGNPRMKRAELSSYDGKKSVREEA